jgi:UDP-glucose 4-epimerase
MKNTILVTGGAGYIGSQTVKELKNAGFIPIVFDNFSTGHREAIPGIEIVEGDLCDTKALDDAFKKYQPLAIMHFAAFIKVEESVKDPDKYFQNNVVNGQKLIKVMRENDVNKIIFSSSAAVYGNAKVVPIKENAPKIPANPYGETKLKFEEILKDCQKSYGLQSISLRYFNASGADPSGQIGQASSKPSHLITRVLWTALRKFPEVEIFGTDYPTHDGTCVRDYIHVKDLALAHILALQAMQQKKVNLAYNLGTGNGYSVKEVIDMSKSVTGIDFKVKISGRREGDPAELTADNSLAKAELGFAPKYSDLKTIIETAWNWHKSHPDGYEKS